MPIVRAGISPKDFAEAIGVSESSVKRWVDQGSLKAARTAGGHRRIAREEALRFIREQHGQLVRPDKLGLDPGVLGVSRSAPLQLAAEQLHGYLATGREPEMRGLMTGLYLAGNAIATLADEVIRPAMERLGTLWNEGEHGIMIEHRATSLCLRVLEELRGMLSEHDGAAAGGSGARGAAPSGRATNGKRVAVAAAPSRDPYLLATMLAGMTLTEAGWQVVNLGPDTPLSVVELAARETGARVVILSFTTPPDDALCDELGGIIERGFAADRFVAIGGQQAASLELAPRANLYRGRTLGDLAAFARTV